MPHFAHELEFDTYTLELLPCQTFYFELPSCFLGLLMHKATQIVHLLMSDQMKNCPHILYHRVWFLTVLSDISVGSEMVF